MIRAVIADDSTAVRWGLRLLLEKQGDIQIVAEASNGHEALACIEKYSPDILLLDISMPKLDGLGVLQELSKRGRKVNVLILSAHSEDQFIRDSLALGAAGYLIKDAAPQTIVQAIRQVVKGAVAYASITSTTVPPGRGTVTSPGS